MFRPGGWLQSPAGGVVLPVGPSVVRRCRRYSSSRRRARSAQCFLASLLKPERLFPVLLRAANARSGRLKGPEETGARMLRRLLVPNLLNGGFGCENDQGPHALEYQSPRGQACNAAPKRIHS